MLKVDSVAHTLVRHYAVWQHQGLDQRVQLHHLVQLKHGLTLTVHHVHCQA